MSLFLAVFGASKIKGKDKDKNNCGNKYAPKTFTVLSLHTSW